MVVHGLPVGLGSFTSGDNRLDSQLAGAVMGIQAIKGVEIGDGFETARRRGTVAHDEMYPGADGVMRSTNRAGGLEGGMTNGQPLRVRAAMKPISTVPRALATVDMATGDEAVAIHQRSDVCAVPAAGVVVETMVALVLARAALEKFGGDSLTETRANVDNYLRAVAEREPLLAAGSGVGLMAPKAVLVGLPGSGKSTIGRRLAKALNLTLLDTDAAIEETTGRTIADIFAVDGEAEFRRIEETVIRSALDTHDGVLSLGGGAVTTEGVRDALAGHTVIYLEINAAEGVRRTSGPTVRPLLAGPRPRREVQSADEPTCPAVPAGRHTAGQHQPSQPRCGRALHRGPARELRDVASTAASPSSTVASYSYDADTGPDDRGAPVARDTGGQESCGSHELNR